MAHTTHTIPNSLQHVFHASPKMKSFPKGTYIFHEGSEPDELYLIKKGKIAVSKLLSDGRELTIRICSRNDIVGELLLFSQNPAYMFHAKALEDSEAFVISKNTLESKLESNHKSTVAYMKWISIQYRRTQTKIRDLLMYGKKGALYSTLIRLANSYGVDTESGIIVTLPLTNQELANLSGTSREMISRMLSELKAKQILSIEKGIITVHNLLFLKTAIQCENCPAEICCME
ncbi:MAG: Crp/Fnr family transcriptional regulator [Bacillus sp. (in: firmicutes)]